MLEINNQDRGSGKTNKVIELMKQDESALCFVPNGRIKRSLFPKELQKRVISSTYDVRNISIEMLNRRLNKLFIDELMLSKFDIAKLFY